MRNSILGLCGLLAFVSQLSQAAFSLPDYEKLTLENGLTVYLMQQDEVPLISLHMVSKAGAINDGQHNGLASLSAAAFGFGSGKHSKNEVEDLLAFHGAELNTDVNLEYTSAKLSIASKDTATLLPLFRDYVLKPQFDSAEFEKAKTRHINLLKQNREQPRQIINSAFNQLYYRDHPYGSPLEGEVKTVQEIKLEQLKAFHKQFYSANNSALIVVGDFNEGEIKKQITQLFSAWHSGDTSSPKLNHFKAPDSAKVWLIDKGDARETTFMLGGKGIPANHPDSVALHVINTILGARFTSWLNDELRVNSGLTYGARSRFYSQSHTGSFAISTFTKKESTFEAVDLALKTYHRLWETGIDEKTLASAKAYVKGQFPPRYETSEQLAVALSRTWSLGLEDTMINNFQADVDALDLSKTKKLIDLYFPRDQLQLVLVGDAELIRDQAKTYGALKESSIEDF